MARRSRKAVDYAESEDDEDFAAPTRKSKRACSQTAKQIRSKEKTEVPKKRVALDDKLYQRDLEVTLALSLNEHLGSSSKAEEGVPADRTNESDAAAEDSRPEGKVPRQRAGAGDEDSDWESELKRLPVTRLDPEKSQPPLQTEFSSSEPIGSPLKTSSPSASKKPSWTPPAASGSKGTHLVRIPVKSPVPGLRLGLSRFARVKPLHPNVASP